MQIQIQIQIQIQNQIFWKLVKVYNTKYLPYGETAGPLQPLSHCRGWDRELQTVGRGGGEVLRAGLRHQNPTREAGEGGTLGGQGTLPWAFTTHSHAKFSSTPLPGASQSEWHVTFKQSLANEPLSATNSKQLILFDDSYLKFKWYCFTFTNLSKSESKRFLSHIFTRHDSFLKLRFLQPQ